MIFNGLPHEGRVEGCWGKQETHRRQQPACLFTNQSLGSFIGIKNDTVKWRKG